METKDKKRKADRHISKGDRHRAPRVPVQLPKKVAEAGKRAARKAGIPFVRWLAEKIGVPQE